jgi:uncharacterized protein (DUF433 family)
MAMTLPDFLTADELGDIRLTGHRIGLAHVVRLYNEGYSVEMIASEYRTLPLALIHKTIAFYLENRADVDAHVAEIDRELDRQASEARSGPSLAELRRRLEQMKQAKAH